MKTILVTGGAGFIGSHVVERLLAEENRVVCLDNFDSFYEPAVKRANLQGVVNRSNFRLVEGDIRDEPTLARLFREERIEAVFHAAARAGVRPSIQDPVLYHDVNVHGTTRLLEAARSSAVKNFVFASSSSVYGVANRVPFSEEDPADFPISPYAATKRAGELLCYTYHHLYGIPVTCLRFFTVYGPRQRPEMAIHKFTRLVDEGLPVPVFGDGTSRRDYTYISDAVEGVLRALAQPQPYEILNIGESQTTELRDLVAMIEKALNRKAQIRAMPLQAGDVPLTFADVSKAKRLLGYQPRTPIGEGLGKFVEWYRKNKNRKKETS
ncbi:MAG TPA: NAD-dependent epimerase/dehydratase family protein [Nitrospiria bacterium]|nr:NAD-dependent epimerase/dehydratase family protein [Nitrospiria bacterium]